MIIAKMIFFSFSLLLSLSNCRAGAPLALTLPDASSFALRICQRRFKNQLDALLIEEGHSNLLVSQREGRRQHSADVIIKGYRQLRLRRLQKKSVELIHRWFVRKQEKFKCLVEKMGMGGDTIVFQPKDMHAVVKCIVDVQNSFRKEKIPYAKGAAKAKEKICATNISIIKSFSRAEIVQVDAVTDGIFRFDRSLSAESGSLIKLRVVKEPGRTSDFLYSFFQASQRR